MEFKNIRPFLVILTGLVVSNCGQPVQEKETPAEQAQHTAHSPAVQNGAQVIQAQAEPDTLKGSLKAEAHGQIGQAHLTITYHSPAVRERTIWGGLVAYNQVWVTGAHSATTLETDNALLVGGKQLAAGKYALFTIPGKEEWTIILNRNWNQHLADDYAEPEDVLRLSVKPAAAEHQERLRYQIAAGPEGKGAIVISWEKLSITVPVEAL